MIIEIDDKLLSSDLFTEYFECDYQTCGGVCCVCGDSGAPVTKNENEIIKKNIDKILPFMNAEGKDVIEKQGTAVIDCDGDLTTPLVRGNEECAYAVFDQKGNCFCAIERAFINKKITFCKPISCHLYPIRVKIFGDKTALNYDRWQICQCARDKGKLNGTKVFRFLKEPIIRAFGKDFFCKMEEVEKLILKETSIKKN